MSEGQHDDMEIFADGNMAEVVRRGSSVFRGRAPWPDAAHQVLRHLERSDIPYAPRLLSVDAAREELSFIPRRSIPASLAGYEDQSILLQVGATIRALHDAMEGFVLTQGTSCDPMAHASEVPTLVCHNDLGPWNVIVHDGRVTGLIDWDLVAPGTPEWDLAYAAWRFAPLYPERRTRFTPVEQALRIVLLLDAYRLPSDRRKGFVRLILRRMWSAVDTVEWLGRKRVPGFSRLFDNGLHLSGHDDHAWVTEHEREITRIVETG
jgi:hypothetical protein